MDIPPIRFLTGPRLYLRPVEASDLGACQRWVNDPDIRRYILRAFPVNAASEAAWFERSTADSGDKSVTFSIVLIDGERHIGTTGLHAIDWFHRRAESGALIGEKELWNRGYGKEAKALLLRYAFEELGLHRIDSRVVGYNLRSARHLEANGYVLEGRRRLAIYKEGEWHDELQYGILASEYFARKSALALVGQLPESSAPLD
ncbi:MAG: N-acetyltransferase [Deltaproteobacteria bacterium CG_4_9_14_3_um_filter_63_12]|nr:MAG: N-acetyltransferase [Deltaproteobacteria bacterium CG_4_9_14_3_um_filter_63_12]